MASVGKNVTFDGEEERFEVNIFDFDEDIYGETGDRILVRSYPRYGKI